MRVAFDGRAWTSPAGGVRRYVTELVEAIGRVSPETRLTAVGADPSAPLPGGVEHVRAGLTLPTNLGWNLLGLPLAARRAAFDVFHAPAYTAPLWGARPLVLTIHDVSYARHPEWYPYRVDPVRQAFYRRSAGRADRILTDSSFSRDEIVHAYGVDPARIDVVPLGVGRQFTADDAVPREPFVLHVGDLHVRRNLEMLLDVVLAVREDGSSAQRGLRLVLAGADRGMLSVLRKRADAAPDALHYIGQPGDTALVDWYRRAGVFAYPSRYEGFGLPVLEAMACGAPVVASSEASIPEVAGSAAILLPVDDRGAWFHAVHTVLTDSRRAADLSAKGRARAAGFSWDRTALETIATYRRAAVQ